MRAGHMPTGKVTVNPARQSQTPGFHPKPQLLPKDIKIFHTLQIISEMPDLKRPLRFKLFQIFQHLQLSPPAETPGVVNLRPPGFQPESTGVSIRLKKQKIQKWQRWKSNINIYQHMSAPYDFIKFNFAKN